MLLFVETLILKSWASPKHSPSWLLRCWDGKGRCHWVLGGVRRQRHKGSGKGWAFWKACSRRSGRSQEQGTCRCSQHSITNTWLPLYHGLTCQISTVVLSKSQQTFPIKGQRLNIFSFVGQRIQSSHRQQLHKWGNCVLIKLYKNKFMLANVWHWLHNSRKLFFW